MLPPQWPFSHPRKPSTLPGRSSMSAAGGCFDFVEPSMKALTAGEMREVDRLTTERYGVPSLQLMEEAGKHIANVARLKLYGNTNKRAAFLCGKGNNGGDGFVAARFLKEDKLGVDFEPIVFLFGSSNELRGDAAENLSRWLKCSGKITEVRDSASLEAAWPKIASAHTIVDALLGTGLRGPAAGVIAEAITRLNKFSRNATLARPAFILAVDIPSGLPSDGQPAEGPVLFAHQTVTFTAPKIGQLLSNQAGCCGHLEVRQIGSPAALVEEIGQGSARWAEPEEFASLPLVRAGDSHKGTYGHVLLLAGSMGKSGAAILAGRAALRSGAGLVTIATPEPVQPIVAVGQPEYMTEPLQATKSGTLSLRSLVDGTFGELEEGKSVLAIGPGLGTHRQTQEFIRTIVTQTELPVLLDADGLNAFAEHADSLRKRNTKFLAITPHPGEMARLLGASTKDVQADRMKVARESALKWNAHVILKGFHSIVASPTGDLCINTAGNAGLAKGGSGDVLSGLLAALTSQFGTQDWHRVLALGVYLHGLAAEDSAQTHELSGVLAQEVVQSLPSSRDRLIRELQRG
ncbi:MAG: bifunctional ADP-dependent NAD(P)H-hydrate dehydratase/NAD(P)H-hydrate epimerase [Acidobacteria bacterium]|nr:MAG: bifunctional ADP-dependent NAD(P)H-hydrate dehydratase/NAD(P)H-hydrate epimerase [Acidobacteriota bacterium]